MKAKHTINKLIAVILFDSYIFHTQLSNSFLVNHFKVDTHSIHCSLSLFYMSQNDENLRNASKRHH
jgi:hypothetical protein